MELSGKDRSALLAKLTKKALASIKKTAHNDKKKPYTEVSEGLPRQQSLSLLGSLGTIVSDTKKMHKRMLTPQECFARRHNSVAQALCFTWQLVVCILTPLPP